MTAVIKMESTQHESREARQDADCMYVCAHFHSFTNYVKFNLQNLNLNKQTSGMKLNKSM